MNWELREAQKRFEAEQARVKERARRKLERERKAQDEASALRAAEEQAQRLVRQQEAARAEERQRELEADLERGDGIALSRVLDVLPIPGDGDKITLPPSLLAELPLDQALQRGPMTFEITAVGARGGVGTGEAGERTEDAAEASTHAGVREFTAEEGFVGLPQHVLRNLCLKLPGAPQPASLADIDGDAARVQQVRVRYVKLPKGAYAQLVTVGGSSTGFSGLISDQKAALESHLRGVTALSEGDVLLLEKGEHRFAMQVARLKPGRGMSVIDTDMEVDIVPPESGAQEPPSSLASTLGSGVHREKRGASQAPVVLRQRPGEVKVTSLTLGEARRVQVAQGEWQYFKVTAWRSAAPAGDGAVSPDLEVTVTWDQGRLEDTVDAMDIDTAALDVDLYASVPPVVYPSQLDHVASSTGLGPKKLVVPGTVLASGGEQCVIGAHGFQGSGEFIIVAAESKLGAHGERGEHGQKAREQQGGAVAESGPGLAQCSNCKKPLPERTLVLHEAFCRRNNALCPEPACGAVVLRSDLQSGAHRHCSSCRELFVPSAAIADVLPGGSSLMRSGGGAEAAVVAAVEAKHVAVQHMPLTCPCGVRLEMKAMAEHRRAGCPQRWIFCRFCGSHVRAEGTPSSARDSSRGLTNHEASCGSRTAPCDRCGAKVMLKDMELHVAAFHAIGGRTPSGAFTGALSVPVANVLSGSSGAGTPQDPLLMHGKGSAGDQGWDTAPAGQVQAIPKASGSAQCHAGTGLSPARATPAAHLGPGDLGDVGSQDSFSLAGRSSRNVECPICGEKVHSERDLSQHFDLVH